jgi:hypothetical protein
MIEFNGRKYAKNESDLIDSLFTTGDTLDGTYKAYHNRIELTHGNKEHCIAIVREKGAYKDATSSMIVSKADNGRFMYSTSSIDDKLFNVPSSYMDKLDNANRLLKQFNL